MHDDDQQTPDTARIALAQLNPLVGDIDGNAALILAHARAAAAAGADMMVTPEQAICGYPAEDLLLKRHFLAACRTALDELAAELPLPVIVGAPELADDVYNACAVLGEGRVLGWYRKQHLPNYGVFDEHRWFRRGEQPVVVSLAGVTYGLTICEDIWIPGGPAHASVQAGAQVVLNLSASPWRIGRGVDRERLLEGRAVDMVAAVALVNQVGGQDELAFDGRSLVVDHRGELVARGAHCAQELVVVEVAVGEVVRERLRDTRNRSAAEHPESGDRADVVRIVVAPGGPGAGTDACQAGRAGLVTVRRDEVAAMPEGDVAETWAMLVLALRDYIDKNSFPAVLIGLSGGIDSALVLALAVDAIGSDRVRVVTMPSQVTSSETRGDAHVMAEQCGVQIDDLAIEPVMASFEQLLAPVFEGRAPDITEENLQARIRGTLLMSMSNKLGHLVLTTGNKSETGVGYSTLYGDTAGGFAPIRDVPKTLVYELCEWRNTTVPAGAVVESPIPASIIERPPTAELRSGQLDTDSLPPYDVLDPMLEQLVEQDRSAHELVALGFDADVVERVAGLLDRAEYKRRQAPPGIRITSRAFGRERRMPITSGWRERVPADAGR